MTLVSVIIPTFNKAPLVCDVVKHLAQQTFKDFEVIVVDDGSTDNTIRRLKSLRRDDRHLKVKVYNTYLTDQFGMCKAINLGLQKSRGSIAFLVNDDIYLHPQCIERHVLAHESLGNRRCAFLGPRFKCPPFKVGIRYSGAETARHLYEKYTERKEDLGYPVYRKRKMVSSNFSVTMDALCEFGGYNEFFTRFTGAIDRDVHYRLTLRGVPILFLAQAQAYSITYDHPLYQETKWVQDSSGLREGQGISTWKKQQLRYSDRMEMMARKHVPSPIIRRVEK